MLVKSFEDRWIRLIRQLNGLGLFDEPKTGQTSWRERYSRDKIHIQTGLNPAIVTCNNWKLYHLLKIKKNWSKPGFCYKFVRKNHFTQKRRYICHIKMIIISLIYIRGLLFLLRIPRNGYFSSCVAIKHLQKLFLFRSVLNLYPRFWNLEFWGTLDTDC